MPLDDSNREIFESAVQQHADSLYRVAWRLTGDRDLASELTQETFFQAWRGLDGLRDSSRLRGWLFGILRFQYTRQLRRESRYRKLQGDSELAIVDPQSSPQVELSEIQSAVQAAIQKLDDEFRMPILLVSMEGIPVEEAAEILGLPRGTVLSRLHRGREKLRLLLEQSGDFETKRT